MVWIALFSAVMEKGLAVAEAGTLQMADQPDVFIKEYWGDGSYTFKSVRTGKNTSVQDSQSRREKSRKWDRLRQTGRKPSTGS